MPSPDIRSRLLTVLDPYAIPLAALALLFVVAVLQAPLVNNDGVLYLVIAEHICDHGFASAFDLYDRPFYSYLIALVHQLLPLSFQTSAYVINGLFAGLLLIAFMNLCRHCHGDRSVMPWAALLLLAHPKINNLFAFMIRDFGYWGLLVTSFVMLLRFVDKPRWCNAIGWASATAVAALFRPEALVYAALAPLVWLLPDATRTLLERCVAMLRLYCTLILPVALIAVADKTLGLDSIAPMQSLLRYPIDFFSAVREAYATTRNNYLTLVLDPSSADLATPSLLGGLLTLLLIKTLKSFDFVYVMLLGYSWRRRVSMPPRYFRAIMWLVLVTVVLLMVFLVYRRLLDTRYVLPLCFLGMVPIAMTLARISTDLKRSRPLSFTVFRVAIVLVLAVNYWSGSKNHDPYLADCVAWMRDNIPAHARIFSNDRILAYYSSGKIDFAEVDTADSLIAHHQAPLMPASFWIIHVINAKKMRVPIASAMMTYQPYLRLVKEFRGSDGEIVSIYATRGVVKRN